MNVPNVTDWVDRLQTLPVLTGRVGAAANLAAALQTPSLIAQLPAAFFLPGSDSPLPNRGMNRLVQTVNSSVVLVLVVSNLGSGTKAIKADALADLRNVVIPHLLSWQPPDCGQPELGAGQLANLNNRTLWWQQQFKFTWELTR